MRGLKGRNSKTEELSAGLDLGRGRRAWVQEFGKLEECLRATLTTVDGRNDNEAAKTGAPWNEDDSQNRTSTSKRWVFDNELEEVSPGDFNYDRLAENGKYSVHDSTALVTT